MNRFSISLRFFVSGHIGAGFMVFDVFVDGEMIGSLDNFSNLDIPRNYMNNEFPIGEFAGSFKLGEGEKTVTIHLPWSGYLHLQEIELEDDAILIPVKPAKRLLAFGDSITYRNAAMHPCARYIARLCNALNAVETGFASIDEVRMAICEASAVLSNYVRIDGDGLVPHDVQFYSDCGCHPNGRGFAKYFENLWNQIKDDL